MRRIIAILILLAIVPVVSANYNFDGYQLETVRHETLSHGGVYVGGGHGADVTPYSETFEVPDGAIKYSRLYVGVWGGTENYVGWANIHFNGASIVNRSLDGTNDIHDDVLGSSHGVYWIVRDVKSRTNTGTNSATVYTGGEIDGRVYCIVLVTVYEDSGLQPVTYWINEGNANLNYKGSPSTDTTETTFSGSAPTADAWLTTVYLTGDPDDGDTLSFNGNLVATDAADGSGPDWTLGYFDLESWDVTAHRVASNNKAKFDRVDDPYLHPVLAILVCSDVERTPDLAVTELDAPRLADHDETLGVVAGHNYVVDATVKNLGNRASKAGVARLYADGATVQNINVPALDGGESKTVSFNWNPGVAKTYTLKVRADATGTTTESDEGNNEKTRSVPVYSSSGQADLIQPDLTVLPTKNSDSTTVQVAVTNNGYKDASNFRAEYWRDGIKRSQQTVSGVSAKASKVISFVDAAPLGTRNAEVKLDTTNVVSESNEGNNNRAQSFKVVTIRIICSNTANDEYTTGKLFDITKRVPEGTTPFCALESVATVNTRDLSSYVYGIDGIDGSSSQRSYWYGYVNGIPVSNTPTGGQAGTYQLHDGEVVRWDYHKYIDGKYNIRPIMDFPEPFKHGFAGNAFATTIVRPSAYATEANSIRTCLQNAGVSSVNIVTTPTATQLANNNLILVGKTIENSQISTSNADRKKLGLPVYFEDGQMHDVATGNSYSSGGVVEACDNRWAGDATYDDSGPTVWIVSGVSTEDVQDAAGILTSGNPDRFWKFTFGSSWQTGDLDHNGEVADAVDVAMMIKASVGDNDPNSEYDLDGNGDNADAVDVAMMIKASVGDITL